jgi:hypothetical protein
MKQIGASSTTDKTVSFDLFTAGFFFVFRFGIFFLP